MTQPGDPEVIPDLGGPTGTGETPLGALDPSAGILFLPSRERGGEFLDLGPFGAILRVLIPAAFGTIFRRRPRRPSTATAGQIPGPVEVGPLPPIIQPGTFPEGGGFLENILTGARQVLLPRCTVVCEGGPNVPFGQFDLGGLLGGLAQIGGGIFQERAAREQRRALEQLGRLRAGIGSTNFGQFAPTPINGGGFGGGGATGLFGDIGRLPPLRFPDPIAFGPPSPVGVVGGCPAPCPALFHTTPCGNVVPNRVTNVMSPTGEEHWFVDAGKPKTWSKVSIKKRRRPR